MTTQKITIEKVEFEIAPFGTREENRALMDADFNIITRSDSDDEYTAFVLEIAAAKELGIEAPFFVKFEYVK